MPEALLAHPLMPFVVALAISTFTSTGGVSGAFLLLPFQVSVMGITSPSVSATNHLYNVVAIPGGVYRYLREGRMLWPLAWVIMLGTLPGVAIGAVIRIRLLPDPQTFKIFAGCVLLFIGWRLVMSILGRENRPAAADDRNSRAPLHTRLPEGDSGLRVKITERSLRCIAFTFRGERHAVRPTALFALSLVVGLAGGTYGIGGGAIIAPILVSFMGLPVHAVAGAALLGTFVTSLAGVAFFQLFSLLYTAESVAPDWSLGLLFGCGGFCGAYLGARLQKFLPARFIKVVLCASVLFVAVNYLSPLFARMFSSP